MIESGFKRAVYALGIFLAGLHLVGFGIWNNGNASFNNPTWMFIQSVLGFELFLLKIIFGCILVYIFAAVLKYSAPSSETKKSKTESENPPKTFQPEYFPIQSKTVTQTIKPQINPSPTSPGTVLKPKPELLTADELKLQALRQITGRSFK